MRERSPYPGLRPFTRSESRLFFGRDEQIDELLRRLGRHRFLAIVGDSGCGKSSLVRAGLIAALEAGLMVDAGARWRVATMRPGSRPLERLRAALLDSGVIEDAQDVATVSFLRSTLKRSPRGLTLALQENNLPENTNFLLLVDQFEELFRISRREDREQSEAFVALLLESVRQSDLPIYVVMTMRSDFLGETTLYSGLPEAVNDGIYLTPRLSRSQRRTVIEAPARVFNGQIDPELSNHLLNELAGERVNLPRLQHLLMRMWLAAEPSENDEQEGKPRLVTMAHYETKGGLETALNQHANEVYARLDEKQQLLARVMFECLCERAITGNSFRNTRRPTSVEGIVEAANAVEELSDVGEAEVIGVADLFRASECNILMPPEREHLYPNSVLDISHESLMTSWDLLEGWMDERSKLAETMEELLKPARRWKADSKADHLWWHGANFHRAVNWQKHAGHSLKRQAPDDYALADRFVSAAIERRKQKRIVRIGLLVATVALVAGPVFVWYLDEQADRFFRDKAVEVRLSEKVGTSLLKQTSDLHELIQKRVMDAVAEANENPSPDLTTAEKDWPTKKTSIAQRQCSKDLKAMINGETPLVEVFVTDKYGLNSCMSGETSDYVQSDEDWWQDAEQSMANSSNKQQQKGIKQQYWCNPEKPGLLEQAVQYDESAGVWSVALVAPLALNGEFSGVMKAVFDVRELRNLPELDKENPITVQRCGDLYSWRPDDATPATARVNRPPQRQAQ